MKGQNVINNNQDKEKNRLFDILIAVPTYGIMLAIIIYLIISIF